MVTDEKCPLCGQRANVREDGPTEDRSVECSLCGKYVISDCALDSLPKGEDLIWLRCATRQASERNRPIEIREDNLRDLVLQHKRTTIAENVDKLLSVFAARCPRPGKTWQSDPSKDFLLIDAKDEVELRWYLSYLEEKRFLERVGSGQFANHHRMTYSGWDYVLGPSSGVAIQGRCFIAMSFLPEHDRIYTDGIEPAVRDAGYNPICLKDGRTNEFVDFRIIAEIRKAEIVVADFTGQRNGVYFESGFARALGREVYWTCAEAEKTSLHFDINHFQHILWKDQQDLRARLHEKILAISGQGPGLRAPRSR